MSIYMTKQMLDPAARQSPPFDIGGRFYRWILAVTRHVQRRRMITALQNLSDRMLADIGLHRSEIATVVNTFDSRELRMIPVAQHARVEGPDYRAYQQAV